MDDFAEADIIRIINKSAKLNETNIRGCLFNSQRAVFLQPQRFCVLEPVVWISIQALPQTVNVQCKFLELSICFWVLSDSCPRRAYAASLTAAAAHVLSSVLKRRSECSQKHVLIYVSKQFWEIAIAQR